MLEMSGPFWFSFTIVLIIVFIINYITQTYLMKKKDYKVDLNSVAILFTQSLVIVLLLTFIF